MPLTYLRDDCHKQAITHIRESRRFKSMYTLQGKTRPTCHVRFSLQSTHVRRTLSAAFPVRDNLSLAPMKSKHAPTPGGSLGNQRQTGPIVVLGDLIHPFMRQPWSRGEMF
jgi:hypothetical protein